MGYRINAWKKSLNRKLLETEKFYWRTTNGIEVDFILNNMEIAIEVKAKKLIHSKDIKPLKILDSEYNVKNKIIVSFEPEPRKLENNINVLPWKIFLEQLWSGMIV